MLAALLTGVAAAALSLSDGDHKCNTHGGAPSADWINDASLQRGAELKQRTPVTPPHIKVDLDLPPEERWSAALKGKGYAVKLVQDYLDALIPKWAVFLLEEALSPLIKYKGFGDEYSREMSAIAKTLNVRVGLVVTINLIYQFERLGVNCSNWNDTGSTGLCGSDGVAYPFVSKRGAGVTGPPMTCTSVVAEDAEGRVVHGRNFDWNLPNELRPLVWEVEFQRGGKHLYTATSVLGFVGVQNAMKPGPDGFAITMDARCQGGVLIENLVEMLLQGGQTPSQKARSVMESATSYADAVHQLATGPLIDQMYFIASGASRGMGAVISRGREKAVDVWSLNDTQPDGWWRLQTNYDHWGPVPKADDRRTPGNNRVRALGRQGMNVSSMYGIMTRWPTFNYHTDHTAVFVVAEGVYNTTVWMGDDPSTGPPDMEQQ